LDWTRPRPEAQHRAIPIFLAVDQMNVTFGEIFALISGQDRLSAEVGTVNRLTPEERRRVRVTQQRAQQSLLAQLDAQPRVLSTDDTHRARWRLLKAAAIAALLGAGLLASQALEFKAPASLVEALLPRL
jgi:hypothetical protein